LKLLKETNAEIGNNNGTLRKRYFLPLNSENLIEFSVSNELPGIEPKNLLL
jgi:hypothetical protein